MFSAIRALGAYILSLLFTLVVGYAAAKSRKAERIIIPMIDILQSIPPLGFMPGLSPGADRLIP
jgi:NitT/TauT family transport system permease protein